MKTLYEGILGDIDDTLSKSDKGIEKYAVFGKRFKLRGASFISEQTASMLSATGLKHATKGMDYIDEKIERGVFDKRNKFKMFANWISHLKFEELGINPASDFNDDKVRMQLAINLENICQSAGLFNNPHNVNIYLPSTRASGNDILRIMISHRTKISCSCQLIYDIL